MTSSGLVVHGLELPVLVINLDSRPDRWDVAQRRLAVHGLTPRRFSALTGEDAMARGYTLSVPPVEQAEWRLGPGALGCAATHLEVYRQVATLWPQGALVLEDDVLLADDFVRRAETALMSRSDKSAVVSLGWLFFRPSPRGRILDARRRLLRTGPRDRLAVQPFGFGTHCYWVSSEFSAAAPELMSPMFAPIDAMIRAITHYSSWQSEVHWPPLAIQDTSPSDIQNQTW